MRNWGFSRYAFAICEATALLAGCGGSQPPNGGPGATLQGTISRRAEIPACTSILGSARCGALIESKGIRSSSMAGWTPADLQSAYNLPSTTRGKGQIVAVVDAYDNPTVASDLAVYRSTFGLPKAHFSKYNQDGKMGHYPKRNVGWGVQIDEDVEMVSVSCPNCTVYLIEADGDDASDLQTAEAEAVTLGSHIVSNSWICYASGSCVNESDFDAAGVTYLAMAGDDGYNLLGAPASFDSVVAVGGTVLSQGGGSSRGWTEMPWAGSGGACSTQMKPRWQHDRRCAYRLADDVSAVAENVAEYDTFGYGGWFTVGGTAVATGLLAGVFGLAGNATQQNGGRTFWQKQHHKDLNEVQIGSRYVRYYAPTGWGTPNGVGAF